MDAILGPGGMGGPRHYPSRRTFLGAMLSGMMAARAGQAHVRPDQRHGLVRVWLRRLERSVQRDREAGRPLRDRQRFLAGLLRIERVFLVKEDIVLEGPKAENWQVFQGHTALDRRTGLPLVTLDDLVVALRNAYFTPEPPTLSLEPRPAALRAVAEVLRSTRTPHTREELQRLERRIQSVWGEQDAVLVGVPRRTRFALVMAYADWEMKRYSLALRKVEIPGLKPYVELEFEQHVRQVRRKGGAVPLPATGSRFWFVANDTPLQADEAFTAFELPKRLLKLVTESYYRLQTGDRRVTPTTPAAQQFARSFTEALDVLEQRFPIFHDLHNLFRLVVLARLIREYALAERINWSMDYLLTRYSPQAVAAPRTMPGLVAVKQRKVRLPNRNAEANVVFPAWGGICIAPTVRFRPAN